MPPAGPLFTPADEALMTMAPTAFPAIREAMERQAFHEILDSIWEIIRAANRYVDEQAPWALKKTDTGRMGTVLFALCETIRHVAILTQPFVPEASARLLDQLAVPADKRAFFHLDAANRLSPGTKLPAPQGVFPRYIEPSNAG